MIFEGEQMELVEKFQTIGGEAPLIGRPIYLIRVSNCNLKCKYCDTPYHTEINETISADLLIREISSRVKLNKKIAILFTGGEPLLPKNKDEILKICTTLPNINFYFETNGSVLIDNFCLPNTHFVTDIKAPSSGMSESFCKQNISSLRVELDCFKLVIGNNELDWTLEKIQEIRKINPDIDIYLSPQKGETTLQSISNFIINKNLPVQLSLQLHKIIWPGESRGV